MVFQVFQIFSSTNATKSNSSRTTQTYFQTRASAPFLSVGWAPSLGLRSAALSCFHRELNTSNKASTGNISSPLELDLSSAGTRTWSRTNAGVFTHAPYCNSWLCKYCLVLMWGNALFHCNPTSTPTSHSCWPDARRWESGQDLNFSVKLSKHPYFCHFCVQPLRRGCSKVSALLHVDMFGQHEPLCLKHTDALRLV